MKLLLLSFAALTLSIASIQSAPEKSNFNDKEMTGKKDSLVSALECIAESLRLHSIKKEIPEVSLNVAPSGLLIDSGVESSSIQDEELRKNYEKSIASNKENIIILKENTKLQKKSLSLLKKAKLISTESLSGNEKDAII